MNLFFLICLLQISTNVSRKTFVLKISLALTLMDLMNACGALAQGVASCA